MIFYLKIYVQTATKDNQIMKKEINFQQHLS